MQNKEINHTRNSLVLFNADDVVCSNRLVCREVAARSSDSIIVFEMKTHVDVVKAKLIDDIHR